MEDSGVQVTAASGRKKVLIFIPMVVVLVITMITTGILVYEKVNCKLNYLIP